MNHQYYNGEHILSVYADALAPGIISIVLRNTTAQPLYNITLSIQAPHIDLMAPLEPLHLAGAGHCEIIVPYTSIIDSIGKVIVLFSDATDKVNIVHKSASVPKSVAEDLLNPSIWTDLIPSRCPFMASIPISDQVGIAILSGMGGTIKQIDSTTAASFYPFGMIKFDFKAKKATIYTLAEKPLKAIQTAILASMEFISSSEGPLWFDLGVRLICLQDAILYGAESASALNQLTHIKSCLGRLRLVGHPSLEIIGTMATLLVQYDSISAMPPPEKTQLEGLAAELEKLFLYSSI